MPGPKYSRGEESAFELSQIAFWVSKVEFWHASDHGRGGVDLYIEQARSLSGWIRARSGSYLCTSLGQPAWRMGLAVASGSDLGRHFVAVDAKQTRRGGEGAGRANGERAEQSFISARKRIQKLFLNGTYMPRRTKVRRCLAEIVDIRTYVLALGNGSRKSV